MDDHYSLYRATAKKPHLVHFVCAGVHMLYSLCCSLQFVFVKYSSQLILAMGNHLNVGNQRIAQAAGFKISFLTKASGDCSVSVCVTPLECMRVSHLTPTCVYSPFAVCPHPAEIYEDNRQQVNIATLFGQDNTEEVSRAVPLP